MKRKVSDMFSRRSLLSQQLALNGLLIAVLTVMAIGFSEFLMVKYNNMIISQLASILEISAGSVQDAVDSVEELSLEFIVNDELQDNMKQLTNTKEYKYNDYIAANQLKKYVLDIANENSFVKFAVLLDKDYEHVVSAMGQNPSWTGSMSDIVKNEMKNDERYKWIAPLEGLDNLVVVRKIVNLSSPKLETEGILVIGIDIDSLATVDTDSLNNYSINSLIVLGDDVIYSKFDDKEQALGLMKKMVNEGHSEIITRFNGEKYFRMFTELSVPGWEYAVYVPYSQTMGELTGCRFFGTLLFIIVVILGFYVNYRATRKMLRPLSELSDQMKKVEQGIFEGVEAADKNSRNEIASLSNDFNVMVKQIDELIKENYLKKMLLSESELKLLQSQINPHFLYNTLESINWMAKAGRTKEISVMVNAMSRLFRSAMSNKQAAITVKEELELLRSYITIQQIRFEERLEVYIDVDEEFEGYEIPKLILQPIVENSIKYALERYSAVCRISIYARAVETGMELCVEDNGPGIDSDRLERIKQNMPIESKSGIALKNIRRRIELMYHEKGSMDIFSEEGKGTKIVLTIPE